MATRINHSAVSLATELLCQKRRHEDNNIDDTNLGPSPTKKQRVSASERSLRRPASLTILSGLIEESGSDGETGDDGAKQRDQTGPESPRPPGLAPYQIPTTTQSLCRIYRWARQTSYDLAPLHDIMVVRSVETDGEVIQEKEANYYAPGYLEERQRRARERSVHHGIPLWWAEMERQRLHKLVTKSREEEEEDGEGKEWDTEAEEDEIEVRTGRDEEEAKHGRWTKTIMLTRSTSSRPSRSLLS